MSIREPSRIVRCPACRQPAKATPDNPARPFCSRRCKLVDLGKWFNEDNRIPVDTVEDATPEPRPGDCIRSGRR